MQIKWLPEHYATVEPELPPAPSVTLLASAGEADAWHQGVRPVPRHLNVHTGAPCSCTFFKPAPMAKFGSKIKWLSDPKQRPDMHTPEKKPMLEHFQDLVQRHPQVDPLLPWIAKRVKKKNLHFISDPPQEEFEDAIAKEDGHRIHDLAKRRQYAGYNYSQPLARATPGGDYVPISGGALAHMGDWYADEKAPNRQGLDLMKHSWEEVHDQKIPEWDQYLEDQAQKADAENAAGSPIAHDYGDGWTLRNLRPEDLEYEGNAMGHCVGGYGYEDGVKNGNTMIYSLRDEKHQPHATIELRPNKFENENGELTENRQLPEEPGPTSLHATPKQAGIVQIQGKGNEVPNEPYQERIKQWMETMHPDERPYWDSEEALTHPNQLGDDGEQDENDMGGYGPHGDYGVKNKTAIDWPEMLDNSIPRERYYELAADPKDLYRAAVKREEIPQLAEALEGFGNAQQDSFQDWQDMNYGHFMEHPEMYQERKEGDGEPAYPMINEHGDEIQTPEEHEKAYDDEQAQLMEEHPGMNLTNELYRAISPHLETRDGGSQYGNQIKMDPTAYVRSYDPNTPQWWRHPGQQMWESGKLEEQPPEQPA